MKKRFPILLLSLIPVVLFAVNNSDADRIQPWSENPFYWQYRGEPVFLLGGSEDDNLFQYEGLKAHLDEMIEVGANFVRNTMSSRNLDNTPSGLYAFKQQPSGKYDLNEWNELYFEKLDQLLKWTYERDIFVQIEFWDRFDYFGDNWAVSPWNPKNNTNYSSEESSLPIEYTPSRSAYAEKESPFFQTVVPLENNQGVLKFQEMWVRKILDVAFKYPHVTYCISNETHSSEPEWSHYWAEFVRMEAKAQNVSIEVTEMPWQIDFTHPEHKRVYDRPDLFSYSEVSQLSASNGNTHWELLLYYRNVIQSQGVWPLNAVKTYGSVNFSGGIMGSNQDAIEKCVRSIMGGLASFRFHRTPYGIGLNKEAKQCIEAMRLLEQEVRFWELEPMKESFPISNTRSYASTFGEGNYLLYFPTGGSIEQLPFIKDEPQNYEIRWLSVDFGDWYGAAEPVNASNMDSPRRGSGNWVALITERSD